MSELRFTNNHRLVLRRDWMGCGGTLNWIMLNPSTATDIDDDQTIRKCIGFAKRWGFSRMVVTNLFTFRATHPRDLKECAKIDYGRAVGLADNALLEHAHSSDMVAAAWGTHGNLYGRSEDVLSRVLPTINLVCIGTTKEGFPLHPCMAGYTDGPISFRIPVKVIRKTA